MPLVAKNTVLTPSSTKTVQPTNYISLFDFSTQYLPELKEEMNYIYGNQSVTGLLSFLGAESSFASDKYIWTEEGRLNTKYTDVARAGDVFTKNGHVFRANEVVYITDGTNTTTGLITAVTDNTFTVANYEAADFTGFATADVTVFVIGSEFQKGTNGMQGSLESDLTILDNKPVIMKSVYEVNGSDATQIGWIRVEGGWLWYLKSEKDERRRWEDRLEVQLMMAKKSAAGSATETANYGGTEGLFEAIETRGHVFQGQPTGIADIEAIVKRFNKEGKIQDYFLYGNEDLNFSLDNMLAAISDGAQGGLAYGIFPNGEEMSLNLGFKGFKRGGYNFFYSNWKLLNDPTYLGDIPSASGRVEGVLLPMGTKEVYEGAYNGAGGGMKSTVPYLEVKYRSAGAENRRDKEWVIGSVGGVNNSDKDTMQVHRLSERMLVTHGANNCLVFKGA